MTHERYEDISVLAKEEPTEAATTATSVWPSHRRHKGGPDEPQRWTHHALAAVVASFPSTTDATAALPPTAPSLLSETPTYGDILFTIHRPAGDCGELTRVVADIPSD